ncbi:hypothetical protein CASFOL_006817 [Castilleja foliolosa]|uniref:F-box domain-containing protein n=1 Tax=Castilleja foliolosa TaxID=1961234 RepID=A0ABD3E8D3_9LAMI
MVIIHYSDFVYILTILASLRFIFMVKLLNKNDDDEAEKPSSAQIVASIDDLLIEIIRRVPFKTLVQLPLVSKYWSSLILDPKLCLLRNRPAVGLIFEGLTIGHEYIDIATNHPHSYIIFLDKSIIPPFRNITPTKDTWYRHCEILQSCNGLLLCIVVLDNSMIIRGIYLAFDPSKSPHYKVVCVLKPFGNGLHLFEVYSSETGSWRKGGEIFNWYAEFNFENGVYWNGAIHWYRRSVYLNLDCDQTPKVFPKPPLQYKCYDKFDYYFGESCDHLHFVDAKSPLAEFIVYEMKRDYSEWFVKYKINIPEIERDYSEWFAKFEGTFIVPGLENMTRRYTLVRGKSDEDSFLVIAIGKRIVRYNIEQKTCETLCDFESTVGDRPVYWGVKRPFQYIESICSV